MTDDRLGAHAPFPVPTELSTARLRLRPWRADDAEQLQPVLEANQAHLGPWIPARVADPATVPRLATRLAGFADDFATARAWRYAIVSRSDARVLGEVSLFPRSAEARVPLASADRAEIGYWLRADATRQGLATEAVRAVLDVAAAVATFTRAEIRCDARNAASSAIPRRLGFMLEATQAAAGVRATDESVALEVWVLELERPGEGLTSCA